MQGAWVWSLVREPRSCMPHGVTNKLKKKILRLKTSSLCLSCISFLLTSIMIYNEFLYIQLYFYLVKSINDIHHLPLILFLEAFPSLIFNIYLPLLGYIHAFLYYLTHNPSEKFWCTSWHEHVNSTFL